MTPEIGLYQHYKGGLYRVIAIGVDEATKGRIVIYQSIEDSSWWTRPIADFIDRVFVDGYTRDRFAKLAAWP